MKRNRSGGGKRKRGRQKTAPHLRQVQAPCEAAGGFEPPSIPNDPNMFCPLSRGFMEKHLLKTVQLSKKTIREALQCFRFPLLWGFFPHRSKHYSIFSGRVKRSGKKLKKKKMNSQFPGLTGLTNLGNTCYMNATLQCLCSVPPLLEYFLSGKYETALPEENDESVTAFGSLISSMWCGKSDCVSPEGFHSAFAKRYPVFSRGMQQDAQEFLICVLDELHKAFIKPSKRRHGTEAEASRGSVGETSIITQLFEGQLSYSVKCLKCKTTINRPENFTILSVPIPSKTSCSLQDCLEHFFQQDTLTRNNQVHCFCCGTKQDTAVKGTVTKAPQIIIFHLKRFEWQGESERKLLTDIYYPLNNLDLSPYTSSLPCKDTRYSLCATVNHAGLLDDGHYTAFCKHVISENWYIFDDAQITKIPDSSVQTDTAYLLFYTRQDHI
ncbi:inactive ubiquitin carboxyl-terminal hydrolase 50 [Cuculus canorus]|uniref:inactive ubiquitin carboxyl-terminal hydrolase 50 n=1 Tax=Cuculus canorus TaxID=55661 RepID=UPI0023AADD74|nr:inactive ubiquitin carboxyl-terminal hydrolase 50 [Cuculus canorus]